MVVALLPGFTSSAAKMGFHRSANAPGSLKRFFRHSSADIHGLWNVAKNSTAGHRTKSARFEAFKAPLRVLRTNAILQLCCRFEAIIKFASQMIASHSCITFSRTPQQVRGSVDISACGTLSEAGRIVTFTKENAIRVRSTH